MNPTLHRRKPENSLTFSASMHPVLRQVLSKRRLSSLEDLELGLSNLLSPTLMKGMPEAVERLVAALREQERVLIVGDFDADGATSCALAVLALSRMGLAEVDFLVPNRFEYGYGLTPEIVALAAERNPQLLITVDNGISSVEGVQAANALGIDTLITDHHLPGAEIPDAIAIVNPNQPGCDFPSKCIAGVGVIFYVVLALRSALRESGWFDTQKIKEPNMAELLDLVALGTVADVVALDRNNRILVDEGLKRIRGGFCRPGINALLQVARRSPAQLAVGDLGFSIGPRLNAAGRLDDMSTGINCLLAEEESAAYQRALQLDQLNRDRKLIESDMREQALSIVQELTLEEVPAALCIYRETWHQGVVGIVASRIKEKFHRPVIAFARADEADDSLTAELKGSARSISGFHIRDALDAVASKNPGLITRFGGHAMAAGLSLPADSLADFTAAFIREAALLLQDDQLESKILSDGEVTSDCLRMDTAEAIAAAGPWGQTFPEPLFDGTFNIVQQRKVGTNHLKLVLSPIDQPQQCVDAIAFNVDPENWPAPNAREINIAYRLDINEYRGNRTLQLMIEHILHLA